MPKHTPLTTDEREFVQLYLASLPPAPPPVKRAGLYAILSLVASFGSVLMVATAPPESVSAGSQSNVIVYLALAALGFFFLGVYFWCRWIGHSRKMSVTLIATFYAIVAVLAVLGHQLLMAGVSHLK